MSQTEKDRCIDPSVGALLADDISGALGEPGREEDQQRFAEHIDACRSCREAVVEDANEKVLMPMLEDLARKRGVSVDRMVDAFTSKVGKMKAAGKLRSKWDK